MRDSVSKMVRRDTVGDTVSEMVRRDTVRDTQ